MSRLDRLLRPRSIAVIGGGVWCANVIEQCRRIGFTGPVMAVHPTRAEVSGVTAHARPADLPAVPDACFIGVNREATVGIVAELAAMGAGGAVCFASGFGESHRREGADLQARLTAAAGGAKGGAGGAMPILGPNCYGLINAVDGVALWPDQHGCARVDRGVAIITQSSNIAINLTMQRRGLPLAYVVTAGNQAQTGLADIGMALLDDARVSALGLHIEGFGDPAAFARLAAHAHALGKGIVALKAGESAEARSATLSHTASLAGSAAGARALLARLGVAQAKSLEVLLETLKILHVAGPLASNAIASMSCSGGEASLVADSGARVGLTFPPLTREQGEGLCAVLGPEVALANPLDYHTDIWADTAAMTRCFTAMMARHQALALGCVVLDFPRADRCATQAWDQVVAAVKAARHGTGRPMAILSSLSETMPEAVAMDAMAAGIIPLAGLEDGLAAVALAAGMARQGEALPLLPAPPLTPARTLTEAEAKAELAAHGLPIPQARRATSLDAVAAAAEAIGFPVVVKGEGLAHKTEAGAVALNLRDADAARRAAAAMAVPAWLVEEMVPGALAELLIGVVRDPAHGFVLTLGAGGVLSEILRDTQSLLVPARAEEITAALDRLHMAPLLAGYRGAPPVDRQALVRAVLALQDYVTAHAGDLCEAEVNPLICTATRAVAVDALIRKGEC